VDIYKSIRLIAEGMLDIAMPHLSGIEVIGLIREAVPHTQIVILSMHAKETYVQQALASGVLGYVLKASPSTDILQAIRPVQRKEYFLSSRLKADVIGKYLQSHQSIPALRGYDLLSEREQQVFRLAAQGHSTSQMAAILCIQPQNRGKTQDESDE
jgi:two-component system, NarL family, response regulator NreC